MARRSQLSTERAPAITLPRAVSNVFLPQMPLYFEIFAASLSAILLEISYTRVFSFKVFYYFTYVILGIALMGIGTGGVLVALSRRLRAASVSELIPKFCFAGGLAILTGYLILSPLQLNVSRLDAQPVELQKLILSCVILALPFLCVGIIVSSILTSSPERAGRLYGTDLVGAALGCAVAIPLLRALDPPGTVLLSGLVLALGGMRLVLRDRIQTMFGALVCILIAGFVASAKSLPDPLVDEGKLFEAYRRGGFLRYSKWDPVFRLDVIEHPFFPGEMYLNYHDGLPGSGLRRFDGNLEKHARMKKDPRALPFQVLDPHPRVLIIGSAGGHEVLASLVFDAKHVTGVELNQTTLSLLKDKFADVTGHLAENPKVSFVNGDARWFLKQTDEKYDLIWYVAPDSYAAMNAATSGAFVLSESYLYTVEMLKEAYRHLTNQGIVCAQFGDLDYARRPNRVTRFITTAREALEESGVRDVRRHFLVADAPGWPPQRDSVILAAPRAFDDGRVQRFVDYVPRVEDGKLSYAPTQESMETPIHRVITSASRDLRVWYQYYPYRVSPVRDDSPFFWHFAGFRDAFRAPENLAGGAIDYEVAIGERFMVWLLAVVSALAAVLLFSPFLFVSETFRQMSGKGRVGTYFAALGLGFMFIEVALIQKLTLLVGYPTRSLTVTLFSILVFSGLGSFLSSRYVQHIRRALVILVLALLATILAHYTVVPVLVDRFGGAPLAARIALTIAVIAPVGLCLGSFLPLGLATVARLSNHPREYAAWAWAVNGFTSVVASTLSTIIAMTTGYNAVLLSSAIIYAIGAAALASLPETASGS